MSSESNSEDKSYTYEGSCHCGLNEFTITIPLSSHKVLDCNCSICCKKGILHLIIPKSQFHSKTDPSLLSCYTFNTHLAKHYFCTKCGMHPYYIPRSHPNDIDVNLRCLNNYNKIKHLFTIEQYDGENWEENVSKINPEVK